MAWRYIIDEGIAHTLSGLSIAYQTNRLELRKLLRYSKVDKGRFDNEDSYKDIRGSDWIRVGFDDKNELSEIEVLSGTLIVEGIAISTGSNLQAALAALRTKGWTFTEGDYSFTCRQLKIDIYDSEKFGGVDNQVHGVYTALDFDL